MTNFLIPSIVLVIILYGLLKKIDIYDSFLEGVKEGLSMVLKIFPTMFTMVIAIDVLIKSNILTDLANFLSPFLEYLCFPKELFSLAIMRPISGNSSLILMNHIFSIYGPDSYLGRVASVLQGSTDTTIYIISLYFSSVGIKHIKYSLIAGLLADLSAIILSVLIIQLLFYT